jgi:hypothetical protein
MLTDCPSINGRKSDRPSDADQTVLRGMRTTETAVARNLPERSRSRALVHHSSISLLPQLNGQLVDRTISVGRRSASPTCRERECILDGYGLPLNHPGRTARTCIDAGLADVERAYPAR